MVKPEIIYLPDNEVSTVKIEPLDVDYTTGSTYERQKIGDIFRSATNEISFVCAHCVAEFLHFPQFIVHIQQHLQLTILPEISKQSGFAYEESPKDTQISDKLESDSDGESNHCSNEKTTSLNKPSDNHRICHECGMKFKALHTLSRHMAVRHFVKRKYQCDLCTATFKHSHKLLVHKRTHTHDLAHKCDLCTSSYPSKLTLRKHLQMQHSVDGRIKCPECDLRFISESVLRKHMPKHTKEKKYLCEMCPKSYARSDKLLAHRRRHNKEFIYTCSWCSKGFTEKRSLKRHTLAIHGKEWNVKDEAVS